MENAADFGRVHLPYGDSSSLLRISSDSSESHNRQGTHQTERPGDVVTDRLSHHGDQNREQDQRNRERRQSFIGSV